MRPTTIDPLHIEFYVRERHQARTDLLFLCNEVLGYKDVTVDVHGPILDAVQKFYGGTDTFDGRVWRYTPACDLWLLNDGKPRKRLYLFPRGHLKTSLITIAHTIQWILNYPDIRILLSTATGDQVKKMVTETKGHFQFNETFRKLFPDYCPPAKKAADFGTQDSFTCPARTKKWLKEPTLGTATVGAVIASTHWEVIKNSDLVDKENVKTPGQMADVISHFAYLNPLLERGTVPPYHGWVDVEGTRYDHADLYGNLIDHEEEHKTGDWFILCRGVYRDDGSPLWPARFPVAELESIKRDPAAGPAMFSSQYLNQPLRGGSSLADLKAILWFPDDLLKKLLPALRVHTTVDLHGMEQGDKNDFTVLTTAGFDRDGRMYVFDIRRGHFTPFETIDHIFAIHEQWRSQDIKIQKDAFARVLAPFFERERVKRQKFPMVQFISISNQRSKQDRIRGLQPWFSTGAIRFLNSLPAKFELLREIDRFPSPRFHDDILDTLADQLQNAEGEAVYDVYPGEKPAKYATLRNPVPQFIGFDSGTHQPQYVGDLDGAAGCYDPKTGV